MSRHDPSAATGQQPHPPARCTCGHLVTVHTLNARGMRTSCTRRGQNPCDCRVFVNADVAVSRG